MIERGGSAPRVRRVRPVVVALALAAVTALAGCASENYPAATAQQLQSGVREVAASAATHDYAGALRRLDALQARCDAAAKQNALDHARYVAVSQSIAAVRADLQAAADKAQLQQQLEQLQQQQQQLQQQQQQKDDRGKRGHGGGDD